MIRSDTGLVMSFLIFLGGYSITIYLFYMDDWPPLPPLSLSLTILPLRRLVRWRGIKTFGVRLEVWKRRLLLLISQIRK